MDKITKTDAEWRQDLTAEEYRVLREHGTEPPFSGQYYKTDEKGVYTCGACGNKLFLSNAKYDSGSGWPSFTEPLNNDSVETHTDTTHGMIRTEVACKRCGSHLGHVFDDGSGPSGQSFCMNSISLKLQKDD